MHCEVFSSNAAQVQADVLVIGFFAPDVGKNKKEASAAGPIYTPSALEVESASSGALSRLVESGDITGKSGEEVVLYAPEGVQARRVHILGLGEIDKFDEKAYIAVHRKLAAKLRAQSVVLTSEEWTPEACSYAWAARSAVRALVFAAAKIKGLKTNPVEEKAIKSIFWASNDEQMLDEVKHAMHEGTVLAQAMIWGKQLADLPPNVCTPSFVAEAAQTEAREINEKKGWKDKKKGKKEGKHVRCVVLQADELQERGMNGILSVGQGSEEKACLIELSYCGAEPAQAPIVIVGKGITFDAGGLNLKPGRSMPEMKYDMCGAAAALALVKAAAELELDVNITAVAPCAENLPSGKALKPSDVITMANGKTVEVLNADAEGRLILADALVYAAALKPAACLDLATLTGACIVALGTETTGLFTDDEKLAQELLEAAKSADDAAWRMPMGGHYRELLKSNCADIVNTGNQPHSGACTAATFLKEFAPACAWAHLDIAGPANTSGADRQSTSRPMPLVFEWLLMRLAEKADKKAAAEA